MQSALRGLAVERLVCVAPGVDLEAYMLHSARLLGLSAEASHAMKLRIERLVGVTMRELDPRSAAPGLRIPLLVIHDRTDRESPFAGGEELARCWPRAQLIATEGLGHTRLLWDETVVSAATAFLREGTPARLANAPHVSRNATDLSRRAPERFRNAAEGSGNAAVSCLS